MDELKTEIARLEGDLLRAKTVIGDKASANLDLAKRYSELQATNRDLEFAANALSNRIETLEARTVSDLIKEVVREVVREEATQLRWDWDD
jgi:chromosome segregation ATPase